MNLWLSESAHHLSEQVFLKFLTSQLRCSRLVCREIQARNMGIHPIFSLFILSLVSPGDGLEEVPLGPKCARRNCCAEDTVCATKVSCPYWQVLEF